MSRSHISVFFALFAIALAAVPAALAKGRDHRAVRVQGVCTQQSTSKLKLKREDRGIEVEFEVDQNRIGVPWTVTLSKNGSAITSFVATTRAPSGSFEVNRLIAGRIGADRITAVATRSSGETCTADSAVTNPTSAATPPPVIVGDDNGGHNGGSDDHGSHSGSHS
jgi:hypothetical protein